MGLTLTMRELKSADFAINGEKFEPVEEEYWRPRIREDCQDVPRPCPYVGCRHNTYFDVTIGGGLKINGVKQAWERDPETSCVLDLSDTDPGGLPLDQVGDILGGVTKEAIRQIEIKSQESIEDTHPELAEHL